jgi:hypothetical protein
MSWLRDHSLKVASLDEKERRSVLIRRALDAITLTLDGKPHLVFGGEAVEEDHHRRPGGRCRADLIRRDFTAAAAQVNRRWCGDITYIATWEGWLYRSPSSTSPHAGSWALPSLITCAPSWSLTRWSSQHEIAPILLSGERGAVQPSAGVDSDHGPGPEVDAITVTQGHLHPGGYLAAVDKGAVL